MIIYKYCTQSFGLCNRTSIEKLANFTAVSWLPLKGLCSIFVCDISRTSFTDFVTLCFVIKGAISISPSVVLNYKVTNEQWIVTDIKGSVCNWFEVLLRNCSCVTKENNEKFTEKRRSPNSIHSTVSSGAVKSKFQTNVLLLSSSSSSSSSSSNTLR